MKASTQEWLNFAREDLMNCELILSEEYLTNIVAFHSRQAVEKAFKALIDEKGLTIPRVHNLQRLYDIIDKFLAVKFDIELLALLDSVYTSSRYPGDIGIIKSGKPTIQESKELYEGAKKIFDIILKTLEI